MASDAIASTFCFCSWNNQSFSACTIEDVQLQIAAVPSNEIRNYFKVLTEMLVCIQCMGPVWLCYAVEEMIVTRVRNRSVEFP